MDMNLEVLNQITDTAVKAAGMRDYDVSPLQKRHLRPDGSLIWIDIDPPPQQTELFDLQGCAAVYERYKKDGAELYVCPSHVDVTHDSSRTKGHSHCRLIQSEAISVIDAQQYDDLRPEQFEKIAKLYFGADSQFINRIRKLQWKTESDTTTRLSSVSKSADISEIAKVVDENQILFQDISLVVTTPYFVLPIETEPVEIELHIIADPVSKTIAFAPEPFVLQKAQHEAMRQVRETLAALVGGEDFVVLGNPRMK